MSRTVVSSAAPERYDSHTIAACNTGAEALASLAAECVAARDAVEKLANSSWTTPNRERAEAALRLLRAFELKVAAEELYDHLEPYSPPSILRMGSCVPSISTCRHGLARTSLSRSLLRSMVSTITMLSW